MIKSGYLFVVSSMLIIIAARDLREQIISDASVKALFIWVITGHVIGALVGRNIWPVTLLMGARAAAITVMTVVLLSFAVRKVLAVHPFGGGDIKLLTVGALALGGGCVVVAFCCAVLLAGVFIAVRFNGKLIHKKGTHARHVFPFGPFLCVGLCVSYLWGERIIRWYLS